MLGKREPDIYGESTLSEIVEHTENRLKDCDKVSIDWYQSNIEGELINKIQGASLEKYDALIINPAGYSHTSVAILDALKILDIPIIEVHLSNTHLREDFRCVKLTAKASNIIMEGLGRESYYFAITTQLDK